MLSNAKNATLDRALKLWATTSNDYGPLQHNTISFKVSGLTEYSQGSTHFVTSPGKVVYMPMGSTLRTHIIEPGEFLEINYITPVPDNKRIRIYSGFNEREMEAAFRSAIGHFAEKDDASYFNCQIDLNRIFALIAQSSEGYLSSHARDLLAPALVYMKENVYSPNFSIKEMQALSDISDTYFRKLFTAHFHMTPQRYVINERIAMAKALMRDSPTLSVQAIAEAVGYNDAFYFSRLFKKEVHESPSHFAKRYQLNRTYPEL